MRTVLLGDSHLARIKRDLPRLGSSVLNAAVGGATVRDLGVQADGAGLTIDDVVVVSVGTNDGAPGRHVPVDDFRRALAEFVAARPVRCWVLVAPPGVDESRPGPHDRRNSVLSQYAAATASVAEAISGRLVDSRALLEPLGSQAFDSDGLHMSGKGYRVMLPVLAQAVSS